MSFDNPSKPESQRENDMYRIAYTTTRAGLLTQIGVRADDLGAVITDLITEGATDLRVTPMTEAQIVRLEKRR